MTVALVLGCGIGSEPEPTRFVPGEEIPLGMITVRILRLEEPPAGRSDLNLLRTEPEDRAYVLHVRWRGAEEVRDQGNRARYVEAVLQDRLELQDYDGDRYRSLGAMPRDAYQFRTFHRTLTGNWVLIYHVPEVVEHLSVRIENPDPTGDGYRIGVVALRP